MACLGSGGPVSAKARAAAVMIAVSLAAGTMPFIGASPAGAKTGDHPPGAPTQLTVDDDALPLAVEGDPQFGWLVRDVDRGEVQTAYELVVRELRVGHGPGRSTWGSGKVRSDQQAYVPAPGLVVRPGAAYSWTVRTWDRQDRVGPRSAPARFEVGLTDTDWHADWIRRPGIDPKVAEDFSLMRKNVKLAPSPVVRARLYASAGQQYDLRVNGERVGHGPSFSYPDEGYYEATDITRQVRPGRVNAFAAVAHWSTPGQGRPASTPDVTIPANVTAAVQVPAAKLSDVRDGDHVITHDPGVTRAGYGVNGLVGMTLGSGHYTLEVAGAPASDQRPIRWIVAIGGALVVAGLMVVRANRRRTTAAAPLP
jgi:Alpha-L-rhamnosidase N-terminal domain.